MEKSKQITHQENQTGTPPAMFWGTITLGVIGIIAVLFTLVPMLQLPREGVVYFAMVLYTLTLAAGMTVIILTLRGRQDLGAQLAFYMVALVFMSSPVIFVGRGLTAFSSLLTISGIIILQLLPRALRRRYIAITAGALLLLWVVEWINPSWRLQTEAGRGSGPVTAIIFGLILSVILVRQAWGGNIRLKLVTSFTLIALISVAIVGTVVYINYRNQVREDIRQRLFNIISLVAMNQDGDLHATILGAENADDESHVKILAQNVEYLATDPDLKYIYTMRKNEQGQIYFVINARQGGEPGDPIGTIYNEPSNLLATQFDTLSEPVIEEDLYTDTYGQVLASYAPFYRADGTREGIIGVDIDAEKVLAAERTVLNLILGTTFFAMLVVTLIGLWLGNLFVGPVVSLSLTTQKVIEGDLNARAEIETADEVGDLAKAFNMMTSQLQGTLQGLERRIADRTHNLELAAEVGRAVSQVRDLDVMLRGACDLILKEFDLYYVQVYLTNPQETKLFLEAGTGNVGAQLVGRGHSLPVDGNSINGRAAVEKRSMVISDTTQSPTFHQNPLLPETRGEMAVPLIVADKVVGVLDMQSSEPGVLTTEVLPAFEALAGQLAVAIQNSNLLAEADEARAEVEKQARRLVRTGWNEHLDAIHKPENIGFVFNQSEVALLVDSDESQIIADGMAVSAPISVTGEPLGSLVVEIDDESHRDQTTELVNVVARQVAQQIENLRLLESAERYRYEAEEASRRITREGWKSYAAQSDEHLSYVYDLTEVRPQNASADELAETTGYTLPITVRDEAIGKLVIQGLDSSDTEAVGIANAVAERLAIHLESLRQYDQTQSALMQSEKLFEASSRLTQATGLQELVSAAVTTLDIPEVNRALLTAFEYGPSGDIERLTIVGNWWNGSGHEVTPVGTLYPREVIRVMPMFVSSIPVFFNDTHFDDRVDATTMELVKKLNLRSVAVLPLHSANKQIGALILEGEVPHNFTQQETRLFSSLAPQIATVVENRRQFEQAQKQAERESRLNVISQKIQSATTVEAVLQIAARELGHTLGAPLTIAQLGLKETLNDN